MTARILAAVVVSVFVLAGCSQAGEVLDQARDLQEQGGNIRWCTDVVRLAAAVDTANAEAARNLVDALNRSGPEDIGQDVAVVEAVVKEVEAGDAPAEDLRRDDVTAAMERLVEAVDQRCAGQVDEEFGTSS
jgi:outer membrane murein-binding lipoprotein Lpp